jgi:hypothetical protein
LSVWHTHGSAALKGARRNIFLVGALWDEFEAARCEADLDFIVSVLRSRVNEFVNQHIPFKAKTDKRQRENPLAWPIKMRPKEIALNELLNR